MEEGEQIKQLSNEVDNLIDRARSEYNISYAAIVGIFTMKIHLLCNEAAERSGEVD